MGQPENFLGSKLGSEGSNLGRKGGVKDPTLPSTGPTERSKKSPTGPTERNPKPEYLIAHNCSSNLLRGPLVRSHSIFDGKGQRQ